MDLYVDSKYAYFVKRVKHDMHIMNIYAYIYIYIYSSMAANIMYGMLIIKHIFLKYIFFKFFKIMIGFDENDFCWIKFWSVHHCMMITLQKKMEEPHNINIYIKKVAQGLLCKANFG